MSTEPPILHVLLLKQIPIYEQLRLEEALLRADDRNWFIWNEGSPPAVVLGISGRIQQLIDQQEWESQNLPLIRRFSGGGTVVVDEQTLFGSWIMSRSALPQVEPNPHSMLRWVADLLSPLSIEVAEQDFVRGNRKVAGNAQYLRKDRWLHHTSFLWDYSPKRMQVLKLPPRRPAYRQDRDHRTFCDTLRHCLESPDELLQAILKGMERNFRIEYVTPASTEMLQLAPHRQTVRLESWPSDLPNAN